jgi:hypothetical protein
VPNDAVVLLLKRKGSSGKFELRNIRQRALALHKSRYSRNSPMNQGKNKTTENAFGSTAGLRRVIAEPGLSARFREIRPIRVHFCL